ncbi:MAG: M15 family metallopeptidase, partial [Acidimicrobiia bacterium]|nr:M15 family metallopeptidase [Acidimicrobiia bacterium]
SMVSWVIPMSGGKTTLVHERILPALQLASANLEREMASGRRYEVTRWSSWSWRSVAGGRNGVSFHAFGTAVDLNPHLNPFLNDPDAELVTDMPDWYVQAYMDAGFCWGGLWVNLKDAMHYSWMGPLATPEYGTVPTPYDPVTAEGDFSQVGLDATFGFDTDGDYSLELFDRSRDGTPELYGYTWHADGMVRIEVLPAQWDFGVTGIREMVPVQGGPATADLWMADYDNDNRADLWVIDRETRLATVYADTTWRDPRVEQTERFDEVVGRFLLPAADQLLVGDYDRNATNDIFLLSANGDLTVRSGVGMGTSIFSTNIGPVIGDVLLDDYNVDGVPDLYLIDETVDVLLGPAYTVGYTDIGVVPPREAVLVGDYDGDGRPDMYAIEDGRISVLLGGARAQTEDITSWFKYEDQSPWDAGPECLGPSSCDQIGFVFGDSELWLRKNLSWDGGDYANFYFGNPGDVGVVGDWDCDGIDTPGMFRPGNGFAYVANANETTVASTEFYFGLGGDIPLAGDWDGDGCDSLAIYRPSQGKVYLSNALRTQLADVDYFFGTPGDIPFAGDFNGDGRDEVGLYRPGDGFVYFRYEQTSGAADKAYYFGDPGDRIVAGDWNGNGTDTLAVHRKSEGRWYFRLDNSQGFADHILEAGPAEEDLILLTGVFGDLPYGEN